MCLIEVSLTSYGHLYQFYGYFAIQCNTSSKVHLLIVHRSHIIADTLHPCGGRCICTHSPWSWSTLALPGNRQTQPEPEHAVTAARAFTRSIQISPQQASLLRRTTHRAGAGALNSNYLPVVRPSWAVLFFLFHSTDYWWTASG